MALVRWRPPRSRRLRRGASMDRDPRGVVESKRFEMDVLRHRTAGVPWRLAAVVAICCALLWAGSAMAVPANPGAFSLASPADNGFTNVAAQTFSWTASSDANLVGYVFLQAAGLAAPACPPPPYHGAVSTAGTSFSPGVLPDGPHAWTVCAVDRPGRVTRATQDRSVTIDTAPPAAPAPQTPAGANIGSPANAVLAWAGTADPAPSSGINHYTLTVSGIPAAQTIPGNVTTFDVRTLTPALPQGTSHTWTVQAVDNAGNVGTPSPPQAFTFDSAPPCNVNPCAGPGVPATATISTTGPGLTNTPNVTVSYSGFVDSGNVTPLAQLTYSVSEIGGAATPFAAGLSTPFVLSPGDGPKTVTVHARDLAGNVSAPLVTPALVTLDTVAPSGGAIAASALTSATRAVPGGVALRAAATDQNGPVRYALSEDAVTPPADAAFGTEAQFPFPRPFTLAAGADGPRTIYVWAKDQAGNLARVSQIQTALDSIAPTLTPATDPAPPPAPEAANFGVSGAFITLGFTKPVAPLDASSLQIVCTRADCAAPAAAMTIQTSPDRTLVTLTPAAPLQTGMRYQVRLVGIADDAGNPVDLTPAQTGQWFFPTGTDPVPPGAVGAATATPGVGEIVLRWSNPADADLAKIRILRRETGPPSGPSDPGARAIDLPPSATTYADTGLTPGRAYFYAIYAFDTAGNPSRSGASDRKSTRLNSSHLGISY